MERSRCARIARNGAPRVVASLLVAALLLDTRLTAAQKLMVVDEAASTEGLSAEELSEYVQDMGCTMPEYAEYAQCSCNENGCCYSQQPTWWVEWTICDTSCCFKLGSVGLSAVVVVPSLLAVAMFCMCMCCYLGKCGSALACCNRRRRRDSSGMGGSDNHSGVMFIPNTMYDERQQDVAASLNFDDLVHLGSDDKREAAMEECAQELGAYTPPK
eukprot:jgi/Tetstr1/422660/TSEL_001287.t1